MRIKLSVSTKVTDERIEYPECGKKFGPAAEEERR
jgi:hypothetical protein